VDEDADDGDEVCRRRPRGSCRRPGCRPWPLATAYCAGPNIWTTCFIPLIVTLVMSTVAGLQTRFGSRTARRLVCPSDCLASALAKAMPTGPRLRPDQQVDVGDLVPLAHEGFADVERDVGHRRSSPGRCVGSRFFVRARGDDRPPAATATHHNSRVMARNPPGHAPPISRRRRGREHPRDGRRRLGGLHRARRAPTGREQFARITVARRGPR